MVWNIRELAKQSLTEEKLAVSGVYFLCPDCMTLNTSAEVVIRDTQKERWQVYPLGDGTIGWDKCINKELVGDIERDYSYMKDCGCELSSGYPEDYIVEVDTENRTIRPIGDYWKNEGYDDLVKFAQENGFQVVSN